MNYLFQNKSKVSRIYTFDNYINGQEEVENLKNFNTSNYNKTQTVISGKEGNGVTHLLKALTNVFVNQKLNVIYFTSTSLVHFLKQNLKELDIYNFKTQLLSYDAIIIDDITFLYKKKIKYSHFILELIEDCRRINKTLLLGCSNPEKDFTKAKKYANLLNLNRINLKPIRSIEVYKILKHLCKYESQIPDSLLYLISGYNGTIQQYINCLISIRFKSKVDCANLKELSLLEIENQYRIKTYFPKLQTRSRFNTEQMLLWEQNGFRNTKNLMPSTQISI